MLEGRCPQSGRGLGEGEIHPTRRWVGGGESFGSSGDGSLALEEGVTWPGSV